MKQLLINQIVPDLNNSDAFHRSDFFRRQGACRAVVHVPQAARNAAGGKKRPALRVGHCGPSGALHCLPDATSIALRTAPARVNRYDPMK